MQLIKIEKWALDIAERVKNKQRIEDSRVELKRQFIDPYKAACHIAGHANSARGSDILWLIGIDEGAHEIIPAPQEELANWWAQVQSHFDGPTPLLTDINVDIDGIIITALHFDSSRPPYVIKRDRNGTAVKEVYWREGTSHRYANRSDLIKILVPLSEIPNLEFIKAKLYCKKDKNVNSELDWDLLIGFYADISMGSTVVIPFHHCISTIEVPGIIQIHNSKSISMDPPRESPIIRKYSNRTLFRNEEIKSRNLSKTIESTNDELFIHGPGRFYFNASYTTKYVETIQMKEVVITISIKPSNVDLQLKQQFIFKPVKENVWQCLPE